MHITNGWYRHTVYLVTREFSNVITVFCRMISVLRYNTQRSYEECIYQTLFLGAVILIGMN